MFKFIKYGLIKYSNRELNLGDFLLNGIVSLLLFVLFLTINHFADYIVLKFDFLLALIFLPFIVYPSRGRVLSFRFVFLSVFFFILYLIFGSQSALFLCLLFFGFYLFEISFGRLNLLTFFVPFFLLPISAYVFDVLGFSLRLMLSDWASVLLSLIFADIRSEGNFIFTDGLPFRVDSACMGIKMTTFGFLLSFAVLSFREKVLQKRLNVFYLSIYLSFVFIFILVCNLFRIVILVAFRIPADTFMHEFAGIVCLLFYVFLPIVFLSYQCVAWFGTRFEVGFCFVPLTRRHFVFLIFILSLLAFLALAYRKPHLKFTDTTVCGMQGFVREPLDGGVVKFSNDTYLVYVKQIGSYFAALHHPLICWRGTGYKVFFENKIAVDNQLVNYAVLVNRVDTLHTIWYYDDGIDVFSSPINVNASWDIVQSKYLVNVTAQSFADISKISFCGTKTVSFVPCK